MFHIWYIYVINILCDIHDHDDTSYPFILYVCIYVSYLIHILPNIHATYMIHICSFHMPSWTDGDLCQTARSLIFSVLVLNVDMWGNMMKHSKMCGREKESWFTMFTYKLCIMYTCFIADTYICDEHICHHGHIHDTYLV